MHCQRLFEYFVHSQSIFLLMHVWLFLMRYIHRFDQGHQGILETIFESFRILPLDSEILLLHPRRGVLFRSAGNETEGYFGVRFDMLLDEVRRDEYLDILVDQVLLGYILSLLSMLLLQNNNA